MSEKRLNFKPALEGSKIESSINETEKYLKMKCSISKEETEKYLKFEGGN
jgi:hypothetical protein